MRSIPYFQGPYAFLSNFHVEDVIFGDVTYKSAEHAFQAQKTLLRDERLKIAAAATPGRAKRLGKTCMRRANWDDIKVDIMRNILRAKFVKGSELAKKLMATGEARLVEGNTWGDTYWGCYNGEGKNTLGRLLMQVRDELFNG